MLEYGDLMAHLEHADPFTFADPGQWESWLAAHHADSNGVWMKIAKKHSDKATIALIDALDVALCYGWIDSHRKAFDDDYYLQRYSARRPNGHWSRVNVDKAEALIAAGRMQESGYAAIRAARADRRWDAAYESQRNATVPDDLSAALARNERAREKFELLDRTHRYGLLLHLMKAKSPSNRATRITRIIETLLPELPAE
ncbi:YdeI/OmpD-associated family protein [Nocardia sp. KC 131]|uniref:YdeI/OmpD-associated family protein n=1 Tax=Nocardia arseniciresistens TaxID=3392119 RepID=UPI00398EE7DA